MSEGRRHQAITLAEGGGQVGWRNDDDGENDNDDGNEKEGVAHWRCSK